jgi:hypothetical protein
VSIDNPARGYLMPRACVIARILCGPGQAVVLKRHSHLRPLKTRARGTPGPQQPRSLVRELSLFSRVSHHGSAGSPASRARCLRFAPLGPRWTDLSGALGTYPPLWVYRPCEEVARHSTGLSDAVTCVAPKARTALRPRDARLARRDLSGLDRWKGICVASPTRLPATAPRPTSDDADQTPLVDWAGCT